MLRIITLSLVLLPITYGSAQSLRYGVKSGLNLSDIVLANFINNDVESDYRMKFGFHAGIYCSADLIEQFFLDTELIFSNKGTKAGERINLYYITIPFLLRYALSDQFSVALGPEFGYLIAARSPLGDVSNTWNNKLDFGVDLDARYRLAERLQIGARYNAGFSSVIDTRSSSSSNPGETIKYQNRTLQFSLYLQVGERSY